MGSSRKRTLDEGSSQEEGGFYARWSDGCLVKFNKFLGFSTKRFEGEILNLVLRMKKRREQSKRSDCIAFSRFERELKNLRMFN